MWQQASCLLLLPPCEDCHGNLTVRLAIELADAGLIALPEEGEAAAPSPGIAIVDGETIIVGGEAAARARLTPRRLHTRFWQDISTEALGRPFPRHLRSADLAWNHLSQLWQATGRGVSSVILALSDGRSEDQLGLILGVARSVGVPVDGLVDAAVAASVDRHGDRPFLHLDLELHRAVLTIGEPGPRRRAALITDGVGLAVLQDTWLRLIAGLFLKHTRFDPFHSAASEQDLFDRLPAALDQLGRRSSTTMTLVADQKTFSLELDRDRVGSAAETQYHAIDELVRSALAHDPDRILLSARAAAMPGLTERLAALTELEVTGLPLGAAVAGAHQRANRIVTRGEVLPLVTDLSEPTSDAG